MREIRPKRILRIRDQIILVYNRCTDIFINPYTNEHITASTYLKEKDKYKDITNVEKK